MAGPWEKYADTGETSSSGAKPWEKYAEKPVPVAATTIPPEKPLGSIPGGVGETVANMATGLYGSTLGNLGGLRAMGGNMVRGEHNDPMAVRDRIARENTYEPKTKIGSAMSEYNPVALIGKGIGWLGDQVSTKDSDTSALSAAGMARNAAGEAIKQAPGFAGIKAPPVLEAAGAGLKDSARGFMQSALKPNIKELKSGKGAQAVDTMLDEGVNVTPGGVEKLRDRVNSLNDKIAERIQNSTATVDKRQVAVRLQKTLNDFKNQVTPLSDIASIQKAWDEFLNHPFLKGNDIPVRQAQEMKQGTYKALGDKSYGELKGAETESQKALARGLKEEIAKAVPEVRPLNAEESKLLNALSMAERRSLMEANKNPAGLGWLTTNPAKFAAYMADRSGLFKSLIARMLNTGAQAVPKLGPAAMGAGIGTAQQAQQIPPPPQ